MVNIDLASFSFDTSEVVKGAALLKKEIDALKEEQRELSKAGESSSEQFVQNAADLKTLNSYYNEHVKYLSQASKEAFDAATREEQLNLVLNQEAVTIKELRDQNKLLNKLRNDTNILTDEGKEELKLLNEQLDKNNEKIKENVDQYTQQKINIGNYTQSVREAFSITSIMTGGISGLTTALKTAATGMMGMVKASLAFLATPIGAVIGAIGLVLSAVVNYLKSTQAGIDAVTKVTRPLSAVFQSLIGVLQEVGKFLFEAFSRPQETLKNLYNFVKNQIMRTFESFGKILKGIFTLDFGLIKEGFSDLADQAKENIGLIADAGRAMNDRMREAYETGLRIDALQKEIEQREIDIIGLRAKTSLALKEQENIMQNQLLSSEERSAAIAEHARLTEELIAAEEKIIKAQIEQLKLKQSLNDTSREELKQLVELEASLISLGEQRTQSERRSLRVIKQLEDERKREAKKAVDERINKEKELIDLYVQQQGIQSRTLSEQLEMERAVSDMKLKLLDSELKAKKISQEQYAREVLAMQQNLAKMEAEIAVDKAARELDEYKRGFEQQMEERRFLSDAVLAQKTAELEALMQKEMEFQQLRLEQGLINQQEFDDAIFELKEANRIAVDELTKEREAVEKQEAEELRAIEFELDLQRMLDENATRFEIEQAQIQEQFAVQKSALDEQLRNQEISQELYNAKLQQLQGQRTQAEIKNEKALTEEKFKLATDLFSAASSFIDKDSKAGKAIALAKAGINMYQGISAGVALGFPQAIPAVAFAAGTGAQAIKDIVSTKVPSASGSGSVGSSGGGYSANLATNLTGQSVALNPSNDLNIQEQIQSQADTANMTEQMAQAVQQGAQAGTQQGSQEGITNLSANREIMNQSSF